MLNDYVKKFLRDNNFFMKLYLRYVQNRPEKQYLHRLSRTALIYLPKIRTLCSEHNIKLYILPLPIPDTSENKGWELFKQDVKDYSLEDILGSFIDEIHYCPDDWYRDGSHFKPDILEQHIEELKAMVMSKD